MSTRVASSRQGRVICARAGRKGGYRLGLDPDLSVDDGGWRRRATGSSNCCGASRTAALRRRQYGGKNGGGTKNIANVRRPDSRTMTGDLADATSTVAAAPMAEVSRRSRDPPERNGQDRMRAGAQPWTRNQRRPGDLRRDGGPASPGGVRGADQRQPARETGYGAGVNLWPPDFGPVLRPTRRRQVNGALGECNDLGVNLLVVDLATLSANTSARRQEPDDRISRRGRRGRRGSSRGRAFFARGPTSRTPTNATPSRHRPPAAAAGGARRPCHSVDQPAPSI